ncbi:MAG: hypothetical protein ACKVQS_02135 [Fimbriimonadaceae bacterium]
MNKTLKLAMSAVLGVALVTPAFAQDNFPDVPENHWAYQALQNLKDKVLFGYPDGFYRGPRMTSRYEFAVALDKMWKLMMAQFDGVNAKISALEKNAGKGGDNGDMAKQLADLRNDVNSMKSWKGSIDSMQKMVKEFEPQLQQLGVDVKAMKSDMSDMDRRLTELEGRTTPIKIGAEVNLLVLGAHSGDGNFGLTRDGRVLGEGEGSYAGAPVGIDKDVQVYHDAYITLSGGKEGEPQWKGVLLIGNLFDGLGNLDNSLFGNSFSDNSDTVMGFGEFNVTFGTSLAGQGMKATVGRYGHQTGKYLFKRISFTETYYQQDWRDNGNFIMDGAVVNFMFGKVGLDVFMGQNSNRNLNGGSAHNVDINPISFGGGTVDRTLGVELNFPLNEMGGIKLAYLWHDSNTLIADANPGVAGNQPANRLNVFGAEANLKFGNNLHFYGAYSQSSLSENTTNALDDMNTAWEAGLGYMGSNWGAKAGYRTVETNFLAAGDWGRMGTWYNPTNVQGWNAMVHFNPSSDFKVYGKAEMLEGAENIIGDVLGTDDDVTSFTVGLDYKLSNFLNLGLSYEDVKWNFNGVGNDPFQRWYTLMLGYNLSSNSKLMFTYAYSDADGKGIGLPGMPGTGKFRGGLFGTQLKVSF